MAGREPRRRSARPARTPAYAWRRDFQRRLAAGGWAAVHWPREYGGRGATLTQSAIFFEELGRAGAPLPANVLGLLLAGPTIMAWGTPGAEGSLPRPDRHRRGDLVPGLLRARGRLGPRVAEDPRGQATATSGSSPARRCGPAAPSTRSGACSSRAPTPRRRSTRASRYFLHGHGAGRRPGPAAAPDHRRVRVQRAVHRGGPDPRREPARRRGQRLEGRADDADERARRPRVLPPGAPAPAARRAARRGRPSAACSTTR